MKREHGGNIHKLARKSGLSSSEILDFSANINPLGPPESLRSIISRTVSDLVHYPDPYAAEFREMVAEYFNLPVDCIVAGNGTSELLFLLPLVLHAKRAVIPVPAYIDYHHACRSAGLEVSFFYLDEKDEFELSLERLEKELKAGDMVFLGQPNNPTGKLVDRDDLLAAAHRHPDVFWIVDEAFAGFVHKYQSVAGIRDNIIVLSSLTKIFAIPGLRLGFVSASQEISRKLTDILPPWTVNTLVQEVGSFFIRNEQGYLAESVDFIRAQRELLRENLSKLPGVTAYDGSANFLLCKIDARKNTRNLADALLRKHGIAIRVCDNYEGLDNHFFRVAVRTEKENQRLVDALERELEKGKPPKKSGKKPAKSLMLQGTGSDVGKSVLCAALCRILLQDGVRVAPFKAQNMSLNSFVTHDGGEMGRAQVVQAQACRLDPDVRMNPVLLKPSSDVGCQVLVKGQPVGNMQVKEYISYKPKAFQVACECFDELASEYDAVIIEGAGSPGEINLKSHDIVNMKMAEYAESPVLLVGDIDRGGVYASFIGHLEVMAEWERDLLAGFVVNRFRGDATLLNSAHAYLADRTGLPMYGVIPYLQNLGLPQEDSVGFKTGIYDSTPPRGPHVEIALIDLQHISNFTDIEPFIEEPDVQLRIVRKPDQLGNPDAVILPGSKNVMADLEFLQQSGMTDALLKLVGTTEIVGICGGYMMMGKKIHDPNHLEAVGDTTTINGMGFLPISTTLALEKTLIRRTGTHCESGCPVHGYEIHHGKSDSCSKPLMKFDDGSQCGRAEELIWGTYLHGIFDSDPFRRWFIDRLRKRTGMEGLGKIVAPYDLDPAFDRLAATVRDCLDMNGIYRLLDL